MASRVLVVIPTLGDRLDSFRDALASVVALRERVPLTLVVVVPPAAQDARELAASVGAVIVDDPRTGLAGAMNAGLKTATTEEFYVGLGDDDLLRPDGVAHLLSLADADPGAVVYYGACEYIDADDRVIGVNRAGALASRILSWGPNLIPHPGTLIRLAALGSVGGFALDRPYTMDLDAFLKLKSVGRFVAARQPSAAFRWHSDSLTVAGRGASAAEALAVKRAHLPAWSRPVSVVWLAPVAWATSAAGRAVNLRSNRIRKAAQSGSAVHSG